MKKNIINLNSSIHIPYCKEGLNKAIHELRVNALMNLASEALAGIPNPKVLDVGCGRGELLKRLKQDLGAEVQGVDIDPVCADMSRQHGHVWVGEVSRILYQHQELKGAFDLVISSHSLEHMPNPIQEVEAMKVMSRRHILIAVPNPHFLPKLFKVAILSWIPQINKGHYYCWDAPHLTQFLGNQMDLELVRWTGDWVRVIPTGIFRNALHTMGLLLPLEGKLMPKLFPRLAESLIVLCRKSNL